MNKAFVRESDSQDEYCPRCGSIGLPVSRGTIQSFASQESANALTSRANFCPKPTCDVAYFDNLERVILLEALIKPVYPKDSKAPICACFGLTEEDIDRDISEGGKTRTRNAVERARSAEARCDQMAANGRSCVGDIQKYFLAALQSARKLIE